MVNCNLGLCGSPVEVLAQPQVGKGFLETLLLPIPEQSSMCLMHQRRLICPLGFGLSPKEQSWATWSPLHHLGGLSFFYEGEGASWEEGFSLGSDISSEYPSICTPELWGISVTLFR